MKPIMYVCMYGDDKIILKGVDGVGVTFRTYTTETTTTGSVPIEGALKTDKYIGCIRQYVYQTIFIF